MSVCATCGRQRTGTAPFCAGCGTRFPDAGAGADAPLKTEAPESGSAETRWDTRVETPRPAYPGPMPPGQAAFGPPPSPRRGGTGLLIALVVVLVLAVGGGAFALVSALTPRNSTAQPPSQPTTGAPA